MEKLFFRAAWGLLTVAVVAFAATAVLAQGDQPKPVAPKSTPTPAAKAVEKPTTAEQVAETSIFFYAYPGGRITLNQIRKTTIENGRSSVTGADGRTEQVSYQRYILRGEKLSGDKIRLDQEFTGARFALIFSDDKTFGIYNNTVFTPREDALKSFENQIFHGLEALLRYKEDESTIELGPREKILGVDYYVLDVTDKKGRKTRFFISVKSYRVMMLTYEDGGVEYKRKFYDYNYAQGTLVPNRTVLWADDKIVEESEVLTVTFGQKVEEEMFKAN